jgi:hypothetical protein
MNCTGRPLIAPVVVKCPPSPAASTITLPVAAAAGVPASRAGGAEAQQGDVAAALDAGLAIGQLQQGHAVGALAPPPACAAGRR